jgi:transposase-like protein
MERRRMHAADLFERDVSPAEIARQVGVSHQIVSDWRKAWRQGGREALRSRLIRARHRVLTEELIDTSLTCCAT